MDKNDNLDKPNKDRLKRVNDKIDALDKLLIDIKNADSILIRENEEA